MHDSVCWWRKVALVRIASHDCCRIRSHSRSGGVGRFIRVHSLTRHVWRIWWHSSRLSGCCGHSSSSSGILLQLYPLLRRLLVCGGWLRRRSTSHHGSDGWSPHRVRSRGWSSGWSLGIQLVWGGRIRSVLLMDGRVSRILGTSPQRLWLNRVCVLRTRIWWRGFLRSRGLKLNGLSC